MRHIVSLAKQRIVLKLHRTSRWCHPWGRGHCYPLQWEEGRAESKVSRASGSYVADCPHLRPHSCFSAWARYSWVPIFHTSTAMGLLPALTSQQIQGYITPQRKSCPLGHWHGGQHRCGAEAFRSGVSTGGTRLLHIPAPVCRQLQLQLNKAHHMCHWFLHFQVKF